MKKRLTVAALAAAAGCAVIFSGCAGCGTNGKANEAAFSSNWYADTSYRYIQPTFIEGKDNFAKEEITYTVTQDKETASNTSYSVEYEKGSYTTTFYATTFDKSLIDKDYRDAYPDNLTVYYYKTELYFPSVTFRMKNDPSSFKEFKEGESTKTECYFMSVDNNLYPLYSKITTDCHAPAELQINYIDYTYEHVSQTVTTSYKYDGTAAKTVITGDGATEFVTSGLDKTDNSLIDVCGLNIAVRAMQLSESLSQVISVYSPAGRMQNYTFAGSSAALGDKERTTFEGILSDEKFNLYVAGEGKSLKTVCVTATLNEEMTGVSQKYWFAAIDNAKNNRGRATMVKMSTPLPFSLGTLNYSLEEITSTLYNK